MSIRHITYKGKLVHEIRCKICNHPIQSMQPHDHPLATTVRKGLDGTVIREIQLVLTVHPNYREITLIMQNIEGTMSRHVTHGCARCIDTHKNDLDVMQKMHNLDIDALYYEGAVSLQMHKYFSDRKVVGVE